MKLKLKPFLLVALFVAACGQKSGNLLPDELIAMQKLDSQSDGSRGILAPCHEDQDTVDILWGRGDAQVSCVNWDITFSPALNMPANSKLILRKTLRDETNPNGQNDNIYHDDKTGTIHALTQTRGGLDGIQICVPKKLSIHTAVASAQDCSPGKNNGKLFDLSGINDYVAGTDLKAKDQYSSPDGKLRMLFSSKH